MSEQPGSSDDPEVLRKEVLRYARRVKQLERMTRNSEQIAKMSQATHRQMVADLERRTTELEAATERAESAAHAKDLFLATMSHEIRTPMNGVIGCIELIDQDSLAEEQKDVVTTLQGSARALMLLLNDVLDFAKLESSQTVLESTPFSIRQVLNELCQLQAMSGGQGCVDVSSCISDAIDERVIGDPYRLRQVLGNLVGNAVKFTEHGSVSLTAEPGAQPGYIRFCVKDSGIGMSEAVCESIFHPFRQADESTTRRFGGTGLGLAICKSLVDAMGGQLSVESELGTGSTFSFEIRLPRAAPASQHDEPQPPQVAATNDCDGMRVLLVDDHPVNRMVGKKVLARLGCDVTTASGGVEAVEKALKGSLDAILMDCSMPDVDGYEATQRIRAIEGDLCRVPIIALTAFAMPGDREKSLAAGMDEHLTKPLDVDRLRATLQRIASRRKAA